MAGEPIGYLENPAPYENMEELNQVQVQNLANQYSNKSIYSIYLRSKSKPLNFKGYEQLSQLGKYYTVIINKKITRLYSVVNFIHENNLNLMSRISGRDFLKKQICDSLETMEDIIENNSPNIVKTDQKISSVPLIIKKYDQGKFTSEFLKEVYKGDIKISKPRGRGLDLGEMPSGEIIMLAGGTGINPYCDLIDLLYKELLLANKSPFAEEILDRNPILQTIHISKLFRFRFYIAVDSFNDIHQLTAYQLNELSKSNLIKVYIRITKPNPSYEQTYRFLTRFNQRFDQLTSQFAREIDHISQIYVCGPPVLNKAMFDCFRKGGVFQGKYRIL